MQCFITALGTVAVAVFDSGLGFLYDELAVHGGTMKETPCILYHLPDYTVSYLRSPKMVLYLKVLPRVSREKKIKRYSNICTGPGGSRRLRLPEFLDNRHMKR